MRKQEKQPWNPFPLAVLSAGEKFDLTPAAISVLIYLGARSNWKGETCVGHTRMCADLRRSKDFVTTALKELYAKGVVKADGRTRHKGQADWRTISQSVLLSRNTAECDQSCLSGHLSPEDQDYDIPAYQSQTLQIKQEPNLAEGNLADSRKEGRKEDSVSPAPAIERQPKLESEEQTTKTKPKPEWLLAIEQTWVNGGGAAFMNGDAEAAESMLLIGAHGQKELISYIADTFACPKTAGIAWKDFSYWARAENFDLTKRNIDAWRRTKKAKASDSASKTNPNCARCKGPTYGSPTYKNDKPFCADCMALPIYRRDSGQRTILTGDI